MSDPRISVVQEGAIATVTLNRPEKQNALDAQMVEALFQACRDIDASEQIRVVILTGSGEKAFCAGGDIAAWSDLSPDVFGRRWVRDGHDAFDALARLRQPVIAVLNGFAFGGGMELAACADVRIAEHHAKIGLPETGLGIIPGWSGTQRLTRRFGGQVVRRMSLMGEVFSADAARELGLVDRVVAQGEGLEEAKLWAARVLERSPTATELAKMLLNAAQGEDPERVIEAMAGRVAAASDDLKEGIAAFREKRKPDFG